MRHDDDRRVDNRDPGHRASIKNEGFAMAPPTMMPEWKDTAELGRKLKRQATATQVKIFELWWTETMGWRMKGSKYLAKKAWLASVEANKKGEEDGY